jgi:hypothetical protein
LLYEECSKKVYRVIRSLFAKRYNNKLDDRYFLNFKSVLTPLYICYIKGLDIPFDFREVLEHTMLLLKEIKEIDSQAQESDVFFQVMTNIADRLDKDSIVYGVNYQIDLDKKQLRFHLNTVHAKYVVEAKRQGIEPFDKSQLERYLKQHEAFIEKKKARFMRMKSSQQCMFFNYQELKNIGIEFQLQDDFEMDSKNEKNDL